MRMESKKRALDKIYKRRDRYDIPEWQRQEVWSTSKKQNLIDTILRGWKLPKFYFQRLSADPEQFEVVDGQQRLATIFEFFDNELPLAEKSAKEFGGTYYKDLPDNHTDAFDDYEVEFDELEDAPEAEVKEFFQRLQEGLPLTSSEKLNSSHSKLRDFVKQQTKHPFFGRISASDKRYGHFDILAKVAAIELDGIELGLRYDDLRAVFESQAAFSAKSNVARRLEGTLGFVNEGFADEQARLLRNKTVVQALLTFVCRLVRSEKMAGQESRVAQFFETFLKELRRQVELGQRSTDLDYLRFQRTINANIKSGARIRQSILVRKLLGFDASFAELMDPDTIVESGFASAMREDGAEIVRLIADLNARYSAEKGVDLLKATAKTAAAQGRIGLPIRDYDGYKVFVDDLYFIFWEGVGNRLEGKTPDSLKDINTLRTELRHDTDHGDAGKVRAKKQKGGVVFGRYSGVPSPAGLEPERFAVVQANILQAIMKDLRALAW